MNTKGGKSHDHDKDPTVHVRIPEAGNTKKYIYIKIKIKIYMRAVNRKLRSGDESRFSEPALSSG